MDQISPLGWVAIIFIILIGAGVNLWMIALLRNRDPDALNRRIRPAKSTRGSHQRLQKFIEVLRDPFGAQRKDIEELSRRVEDLKKDPPE